MPINTHELAWCSRRRVAAIALGALIIVSGSTSAQGLETSAADKPTAAVDALEGLGLLEVQEGKTITSSLAPETGLSVDGPAGRNTTLAPVTSAVPAVEAGGRLLEYPASSSYQYALTGAGAASNAGYIIITDADAPNEFQFGVQADGQDAALVSTEDGGVDVVDSVGEVVNQFAAPWATDADGVPLNTSYRVEGSIITQIVDHAGASYPVVADPQLTCDAIFCTILLSKAETRNAATTSNTAAAAVVAACGPVAWACAISAGVFLDSADQANNRGKCVGVRRAHPSLVAWPVIDTCRS